MTIATALLLFGVVGLLVLFLTGRRRRDVPVGGTSDVAPSSAPSSAPLPTGERRPISLMPPKPDEDPDTTGPRPPVVVASGFEEEEWSTSFETFSVLAAARSDQGKVRGNNEDAFICLDQEYVFAIADGMGGEAGGEIASQFALEAVARTITDRPSSTGLEGTVQISRRGRELVQAIVEANQDLIDRVAVEPQLRGMGTTIVLLKFSPKTNRVYIAHVGDSRAYLIRGGEIKQLTKDHTYGEIAGARGGMASKLAWVLGVDKQVHVEIQAMEPETGDKYLLCSDGLTKMLKDRELLDAILTEPDLDRCVGALIDAANARGGHDNVTALLISVVPFRSMPRKH